MYRNTYYNSKGQECYLFTWDEHGNRVVEKHRFKPYFYIESNTDEPDAISIYNTKLKKKEFKNAYERHKASRDGAIKRLYHNIQVEQQFLIDRYKDEYEEPDFTQYPLKVCFLDIEVFSPDEFPEAKDANHPINLITIHDNISNCYYTWGTKEYTGTNKDVVYTYCTSEHDLLDKFLSFWEDDYYPDILSGWNTDFFDTPYLINRISQLLGSDHVNRLSPVNSVWCREGIFVKGQQLDKWYIRGIAMMDYLEVYRSFSRVLLESYALNFVAEYELGEGEGKLAFNATNLATLSETDWDTFVDYNIQDVSLLDKIENKNQLFKIIRMLAYKGLTSFEAALGKVAIVTGCVALEAYKHNMVIPTFVTPPLREEIGGGFVNDPVHGLQTNIVSYDANSLYPNTIITLNISPETKIGKIVNRKDGGVTIRTVNSKEYNLTDEKFSAFIKKEKIAISKTGVLYTQKFKGVVPSFVDGLYSERVVNKNEFVRLKKELTKYKKGTPEYKKCFNHMERADSIQFVIKILLNSIYGVFANKFSPICDSDHAGSITLTGQSVVKQASVIIDRFAKEKYGYEGKTLTVYGDTDSTYVSINPLMDIKKLKLIENDKVTPEGLEFIDNEMGPYLNEKIKEWAAGELLTTDARYFFKREAIASVGVFLAKKRYIIHVLNDEGADVKKFKYVGVEIARSTTPKKAKVLIRQVIENSLLSQSQSTANKIYRDVYKEFKKLSVEDVAIRGGLSDIDKHQDRTVGFNTPKGTPGHVRGAIMYNRLLDLRNLDSKYEKITSGGKVKKIYTQHNKFKIDTLCFLTELPEELKDFKVDYEKMFTKLITPPVQSVYTALNWELPIVDDDIKTDLLELFS